MKKLIKSAVRSLGYEIVRPESLKEKVIFKDFSELDSQDLDSDTFRQVRSYTMTSRERVYALTGAVEYLCDHSFAGAFVECGVWKGGSMMAAAFTLLGRGVTDREFYLFDTFQGMSAPNENDEPAALVEWESQRFATHNNWCYAPIDEVSVNLASTGYPMSRINLIPGKVEETVPSSAPDKIALLRLDTDWYESTRHCLDHLFPRLIRGGVLIIDDYGDWKGCRKAVDEWCESTKVPLFLHRIDHTGRIGVKL